VCVCGVCGVVLDGLLLVLQVHPWLLGQQDQHQHSPDARALMQRLHSFRPAQSILEIHDGLPLPPQTPPPPPPPPLKCGSLARGW
jgi:hypothetical protein